MAMTRHVIVTGANRGIGKAICQSSLHRNDVSPLKLFATSRAGNDLGLTSSDGASRSVLYPSLDISDGDSVRAFARHVEQSCGKIDILINNAGVNLDQQYNGENARKTLEVNYWSTLRMCQTFIPMLSSNGRIVNLSSIASHPTFYGDDIRRRFRDPGATLADLDRLAEEYLDCVRDGTEVAAGFGGTGRSYNVSKSLITAATRVLARENPSLTINSCCPGWVATDMGALVLRAGDTAPKTPAEGARIPVRLAFDDIGGSTGDFWANSSVSGKGDGKVRKW